MQNSVSPLNTLLLPHFSNIDKQHDNKKYKRNLEYVFDLMISLPVLLCVLVYSFSYEIIYLWFPKHIVINSEFQLLIISIAFYLVYFIVSAVLNGLYKFPYVTIISFLSLLTMIAYNFFTMDNISYKTILLSLSISLYVLGLLSFTHFIFLTKIKIINRKNVVTFIVLIFFTFFSIKLKIYDFNILLKIILMFIASIITLRFLKSNRHLWVEKIFNFIGLK